VSGTDVYAGGWFSTAGGVPASCIAKWNGSAWSALGSGMNDGVYALAVSGTDLYAGGDFATAGGVAVSRIAKWNGSAWSALGGMNGPVYALAVSGTDVYAGGWFTGAVGVPANYIAKWNGSSWSALGTGMNSDVYALSVSGTDVYAGGWFSTAGGVPASCIAKWNGSAWSALGSGMDGRVSALATDAANHLFLGGDFYIAGTTTLSPFIAQANLGPEIAVEQPSGTDIPNGGSRDFGNVNVGSTPTLTFTIRDTGSTDLTDLSITTNGTDAAMFTVTASPTAPVSGPSGSTTFTVQFAPTSSGAKTAAIRIASNDGDENPFDIALTGTGTPPILVPTMIKFR
jgi:hypothetical protein